MVSTEARGDHSTKRYVRDRRVEIGRHVLRTYSEMHVGILAHRPRTTTPESVSAGDGKNETIAFAPKDLRLEKIRIADEAGDEATHRRRVELRRRGKLLDASVPHDGDTVGQGQSFVLVVRDVYDRYPEVPLQRFDLRAHDLAQPRVECAQGFVHEEQTRAEDECAG